MPTDEMNFSALSLEEDEATATTLWATSEASRALGSRRRSRTNTVAFWLSYGTDWICKRNVLSAIQPVATHQLALIRETIPKEIRSFIPIIPHRIV